MNASDAGDGDLPWYVYWASLTVLEDSLFMPKRRKSVISLDEVYPETPREMPVSYWVNSLLTTESEEKDLIRSGASPKALAGIASRLVYALSSLGKLSLGALRAEAAMALPEVERFVTHPGRYVESARTIYWDWTMDASCAEEVPAQERTVAGAARNTASILRHYLPADPSDGGSPARS